jgi:NADH-ubiquinone oxidoreductase chain 4
MVKTPLYPFISWLLAAHTEAPVEGSVLLAGIVLKLATFGISVILIANLWEGSSSLMAVAEALGLITLFVSSLAMVQQYDLKGFVALSSVAHMSLGVLGLMCLSQSGLYGGWILGFAHGIISPCLFILFGGYIYRSFSTRLIYPLRGVNVAVPLASIAIFTSLLANIGFPPFANWVSEILILVSLVDKLIFTGSVATILLIFAVIYTL